MTHDKIHNLIVLPLIPRHNYSTGQFDFDAGGKGSSLLDMLKEYNAMEGILLERMFRLAFPLRIDALPVIATKSNMIVNNALCFK